MKQNSFVFWDFQMCHLGKGGFNFINSIGEELKWSVTPLLLGFLQMVCFSSLLYYDIQTTPLKSPFLLISLLIHLKIIRYKYKHRGSQPHLVNMVKYLCRFL